MVGQPTSSWICVWLDLSSRRCARPHTHTRSASWFVIGGPFFFSAPSLAFLRQRSQPHLSRLNAGRPATEHFFPFASPLPFFLAAPFLPHHVNSQPPSPEYPQVRPPPQVFITFNPSSSSHQPPPKKSEGEKKTPTHPHHPSSPSSIYPSQSFPFIIVIVRHKRFPAGV